MKIQNNKLKNNYRLRTSLSQPNLEALYRHSYLLAKINNNEIINNFAIIIIYNIKH